MITQNFANVYFSIALIKFLIRPLSLITVRISLVSPETAAPPENRVDNSEKEELLRKKQNKNDAALNAFSLDKISSIKILQRLFISD
jgi:hypothetical protein